MGWLLVCLIARRLHDVGRSGWWQLLPTAALAAAYALNEPVWMARWGVTPRTATVALEIGYATYLGFLVLLGILPARTDPAAAEAF